MKLKKGQYLIPRDVDEIKRQGITIDRDKVWFDGMIGNSYIVHNINKSAANPHIQGGGQ